MYSNNESGIGMDILKIIGLFFLCWLLVACSQSCSRDDHNMVVIEGNYCYEADTYIIYVESEVGRYGTETTYTPYYDSDGNMCSYNPTTGEWTAIVKDGK